MESNQFAATLMRTSARGFASLAAGHMLEKLNAAPRPAGGFQFWQDQLTALVLELAAALEDNSGAQFSAKVGWTRDSPDLQGIAPGILVIGLEELQAVLKDSLAEDVQDRLDGYFELAQAELKRLPSDNEAGPASNPRAQAVLHQFLVLVAKGESSLAIEQVMQSVESGRLSVHEALDSVLMAALKQLGCGWHRGTVSIAEEHLTSQTVGRVLERILLSAPKGKALERMVLLSSAEGDAHDLGLRILAAKFELAGWKTVCLGANTPTPALASYASKLKPDLVIIGATLNIQRKAVAQAIEHLRQAAPQVKILVGGPAFLGLERRGFEWGSDACTSEHSEALRMGRELVLGKS